MVVYHCPAPGGNFAENYLIIPDFLAKLKIPPASITSFTAPRSRVG
jgi:hypothetical protein